MHDRRRDRIATTGKLHQPAIFVMIVEANVRQLRARAQHLFAGRDHLGLASDDILAMLVGAAAVEDQDFLLRTLLDDGDRGGDRVARCDGAAEAQRLVQIDGARTG